MSCSVLPHGLGSTLLRTPGTSRFSGRKLVSRNGTDDQRRCISKTRLLPGSLPRRRLVQGDKRNHHERDNDSVVANATNASEQGAPVDQSAEATHAPSLTQLVDNFFYGRPTPVQQSTATSAAALSTASSSGNSSPAEDSSSGSPVSLVSVKVDVAAAVAAVAAAGLALVSVVDQQPAALGGAAALGGVGVAIQRGVQRKDVEEGEDDELSLEVSSTASVLKTVELEEPGAIEAESVIIADAALTEDPPAPAAAEAAWEGAVVPVTWTGDGVSEAAGSKSENGAVAPQVGAELVAALEDAKVAAEAAVKSTTVVSVTEEVTRVGEAVLSTQIVRSIEDVGSGSKRVVTTVRSSAPEPPKPPKPVVENKVTAVESPPPAEPKAAPVASNGNGNGSGRPKGSTVEPTREVVPNSQGSDWVKWALLASGAALLLGLLGLVWLLYNGAPPSSQLVSRVKLGILIDMALVLVLSWFRRN